LKTTQKLGVLGVLLSNQIRFFFNNFRDLAIIIHIFRIFSVLDLPPSIISRRFIAKNKNKTNKQLPKGISYFAYRQNFL